MSFVHNLIDGFATPLSGITQDQTEILKPPGFVDAASGNYRVGNASGAINSGTLVSRVYNDLDGNTRPLFDAFDMGAYEYTSPSGSVRILSWKEKKK